MNHGDSWGGERRYQISHFYTVPLEWIPLIAVTGVVLIASAGLLGHLLGMPTLQSFVRGLPAIGVGESAFLLFFGITLWLLHPTEIPPLRRRAGQALALVCLLPIVFTLFALYLFPGNTPEWLVTAGSGPGASETVIYRDVALIMSGLALFLLSLRRPGVLPLIQWLAVLILTLTVVILFGYIYSLTAFYSFVSLGDMAVPTALALAFLTNGLLFARPHDGIMRLITSDAAGGVIMRRLLPIVVAAPLLIGWLTLAGQRLGLITPYFGLAMHEVLTTLLITVFIIHIAISLNREERLRQSAEAGAKKYQSDLAHMVRINTLGEMVASIAHELKQPLTAISLYAATSKDMLTAASAHVDELQEQLNEIELQAQRAAEIIRRTREFAHKKEPQSSRMPINDLIIEVTDFLGAEAKNSDVKLQLTLAPQLPMVDGDAIQLRQVLLNIIHNAIESLQADQNKPRQVKIQTSLTESGEICTVIRDNGPGMEADTLSHIFESFFTTKGDSGMGMGLSISRSIIEAHGGKLWATSSPGEGATFTFTLPVEG